MLLPNTLTKHTHLLTHCNIKLPQQGECCFQRETDIFFLTS